MNTIWYYLRNVFDTVTKRSSKLTLIIIVDHASRLFAASSDPDIMGIYNRTKPLHDEYAGKWSDSVTEMARRASVTLELKQKMVELTDVKVPKWDATVQLTYLPGTPQYKAIFNHGRTALRTGSYDYRIGIVDSMAKVLKDYPALAALQTEVENYHKSLISLRDLRNQRDLDVARASENLELARIGVSDIMFANLGFLMNKHYQNPSLVEKYFDLSLLRTHASENGNGNEPQPVTATVAALATKTILAGGFDSNSYFNIINTGKTSLKFYTAKLPDDPLPGSAMELLTGQECDVFASELGASGNLFLMVYNPDGSDEGSFSFMMNEPDEE